MALVLAGKAGSADVPAVLDRLRQLQDADVVLQRVAVPPWVLDDPGVEFFMNLLLMLVYFNPAMVKRITFLWRRQLLGLRQRTC